MRTIILIIFAVCMAGTIVSCTKDELSECEEIFRTEYSEDGEKLITVIYGCDED